jgi:hypothetical protein
MPSERTWRRVVEQAWDGDPRHLLELLLCPHTTDNAGAPSGAAPFYDLPQDAELRHAVLHVLLFGPWKGAGNVEELMLKTGWGKGKPSLSDYEVSAADVFVQLGQSVDSLAAGLGVEPETLQRRIRTRRKKKQGT